jgi:MAC/Perforin domain
MKLARNLLIILISDKKGINFVSPKCLINKLMSKIHSFFNEMLFAFGKKAIGSLLLSSLLLLACNDEPEDLPGPYEPIEEADLVNGIENLGSGYDVFESFADASKVKATILDYAALNADGAVEMKNLEHSTFKTTSGTSIAEYSNSLSVSVGLSGSYMYFSGSVKTNFSESRYSYDTYSYATYHSMINKYQLRIPTDWTADDLKPYMTTQAKNKINDASVTPTEIFQIYGTHCLTGVVVGGRLDYSISGRTSDLKTNVGIGVYAEASFSTGLGSGSMSTSVISEEELHTFESSMEKHLEVYGGSSELGQHIIVKDDYDAWIGSIEDNLVFCNFTQNGLIPIWYFCDDASRKAELEAAYATWAEVREIAVYPAPRVCILDVIILEGASAANPYTDRTTNRVYYRLNYDLNNGAGGAYIYIYYLPGMENDTIVPLAEIATIDESDGETLAKLPDGFVKINHDLNHGAGGDYIYLAYRRRDTISDKLITGLRVNSAYSMGTNSGNQWNVVTQGYYSSSPQDMAEGAGGSTIYLYFTDDFVEESVLARKK